MYRVKYPKLSGKHRREVLKACPAPWKTKPNGGEQGTPLSHEFSTSSLPAQLFCHGLCLPTVHAFLQVNRGLTQENTCGLLTTGNTFACQACASQIKHALLRMIYEPGVTLGVRAAERGWGSDGSHGGSRWGGGLASVRFVLQEDWCVAVPRGCPLQHTALSLITAAAPVYTTLCLVFLADRLCCCSLRVPPLPLSHGKALLTLKVNPTSTAFHGLPQQSRAMGSSKVLHKTSTRDNTRWFGLMRIGCVPALGDVETTQRRKSILMYHVLSKFFR